MKAFKSRKTALGKPTDYKRKSYDESSTNRDRKKQIKAEKISLSTNQRKMGKIKGELRRR